jgi:hypothetical protein
MERRGLLAFADSLVWSSGAIGSGVWYRRKHFELELTLVFIIRKRHSVCIFKT